MAALCPDIDHPSDEWIDQHVRDTGVVDQDNLVPAEERVTLSALKEILDSHQVAANERFSKAEQTIESLKQRNAIVEADKRDSRLDKREKDK